MIEYKITFQKIEFGRTVQYKEFKVKKSKYLECKKLVKK